MVNGMELSLYVNNALNDHPFLYDLAALGVGGSALGSTFTVRPRTVGMGMLYRW
jgi:outer membrane receptor protein involved in Fe transport